MSRTIELGRAVLSPAATNLELWLTTLITLSPKQHPIDLQHFYPISLVDLLSSGEIWVERGNGMHILLDITLRGEPLGTDQLRSLAEGIVKAPAWKQLNLLPSLPLNQQLDPGRLQINIAQLRDDDDKNVRKSHRICANVPAADARPPDGIPVISLQSVQFSMVIPEKRPKVASMRQRLSKAQFTNTSNTSKGATMFDHRMNKNSDRFLDDVATTDKSEDENLFAAEESSPPAQSRKRRRPLTLPNRQRLQTPTETEKKPRLKRANTLSAVPVILSQSTPEIQIVQDLVDAAVRLSVLNNLKGSANGMKVKANTFLGGLADVAPALWRPGYLAAVTQRAHLAPTIGLSLSRIGTKAQYPALRSKMASLVNHLPHQNNDREYASSDDPLDMGVNISASILTDRIWEYTQKILLSKPFSGAIQSFCIPGIHLTPITQDDILEAIVEDVHGKESATVATKYPTRAHVRHTGRTEDDDAADDEMLFSEKSISQAPTTDPSTSRIPSFAGTLTSPNLQCQTDTHLLDSHSYHIKVSAVEHEDEENDDLLDVESLKEDEDLLASEVVHGDEDLFTAEIQNKGIPPRENVWLYDDEKCDGLKPEAIKNPVEIGIPTF